MKRQRLITSAFLLSRGFVIANAPPTIRDQLGISQTLDDYAFAVDMKQWADLSNVFAPNIIADYGVLGKFSGLENLRNGLENVFSLVDTHHALSSRKLTVSPAKWSQMEQKYELKAAQAITYFTSQQFGTGLKEGESVTLVGRYEDELVQLASVISSSGTTASDNRKRHDLGTQESGGGPSQADHYWDWIFGGAGVGELDSQPTANGNEEPTAWRIRSRKVILMVSSDINEAVRKCLTCYRAR